MDGQKNESKVIERYGFILLGVFTSCCFTRNFFLLDLIRYPQIFSSKASNGGFEFELPESFPHEQAILSTSDGLIFSKIRDLPLQRSVKKAQKVKLLKIFQSDPLYNPHSSATLTYWPLFGFAHTGPIFSLEGSISKFFCRIVQYSAKAYNLPCTSVSHKDGVSSLSLDSPLGLLTVEAVGTDNLQKFELRYENSRLSIDIEKRIISVSEALVPRLYSAISRMVENGGSLSNCTVKKNEVGDLVLTYQDQ